MIKLFTVISGREIVGTLQDSPDGSYKIKSPMVVHPVQQSSESYGLTLYPYSPSNPDGAHLFNRDLIISESDSVPDDLETNYIRETSGISIVTSLK